MTQSKQERIDPIMRAIKHHTDNGVDVHASWADLSERKPVLIEAPSYYRRVSLDEAQLLCVGLACAERRYKTGSDIADDVFAILDGSEWSASTLEQIADVFNAAGRTISDVDEDPTTAALLRRPGARLVTVDSSEPELCARCQLMMGPGTVVVDVVNEFGYDETIGAACLRDRDEVITEPAAGVVSTHSNVMMRTTNGGCTAVQLVEQWWPGRNANVLPRVGSSFIVEALRVQSMSPIVVYDESAHELITKTGRVLSDADVEQLAAEAEAGYDVEQLRDKPNRRAPLTERSRCGIHGDPTSSGRCASCDAERAQS